MTAATRGTEMRACNMLEFDVVILSARFGAPAGFGSSGSAPARFSSGIRRLGSGSIPPLGWRLGWMTTSRAARAARLGSGSIPFSDLAARLRLDLLALESGSAPARWWR